MKTNRKNTGILQAVKKGYIIDADGNVFFKGRQRKLEITQDNYYMFTIRISDGCVRVSVARFQAYKKYGDLIFEENIQVRHRNNISTDNSWDNILIGTASMNAMDNSPENRLGRAINASKSRRVFTDDQVRAIIADHNSGMSYNKLIEKYNTKKGTLSYLFNKASYRSLGN